MTPQEVSALRYFADALVTEPARTKELIEMALKSAMLHKAKDLEYAILGVKRILPTFDLVDLFTLKTIAESLSREPFLPLLMMGKALTLSLRGTRQSL